jgi:hypothetical protein
MALKKPFLFPALPMDREHFLGYSRKDFMSMKKFSNDTSWDRTSDLPICSTAP